MPASQPSDSSASQEIFGSVRSTPDAFRVICWLASAGAVLLLAWIVVEIAIQAWPAVREFGLSFISESRWQPNRDRFGALSFLTGTVTSSLLAILLALPLGLAVAIFLNENFLPLPIRQFIRFVVEMLAAIPSVVYGLWGIAVVIPLVQEGGGWLSKAFPGVPIFAGPVYGNSLITASLVLGIMILPTITAISRSSLDAVPRTMREGAYALGATRWETIFRVILPTAAPGIVAATILALGRAMGETMAVAMLIGNSSRLSWSIFSPAGTLAGLLANQFGEAEGMQVSALMFAALLLVILTLLVNMAGEAVLRYTQRQTKGLQ